MTEVERFVGTLEEPAWERAPVRLKRGWGDYAVFRFDGARYTLKNGAILRDGVKVGRVADWGRTLFIGPDDAPTHEEYLRRLFERDLAEGRFPTLTPFQEESP